jgi:hypothetical protein
VSDSAPETTRSFVRYAAYLSSLRQKLNKKWVLFQLSCGNSGSPNTAAGGYKDNRPEYFFYLVNDGGAAHRQKFADAGVVALLFGPGAAAQSSYTNDIWTDGQPFLKTHVAAYYQSPLPLP